MEEENFNEEKKNVMEATRRYEGSLRYMKKSVRKKEMLSGD